MQCTFQSPLWHNLPSDKETFNDDDLTVDALLKCSQILIASETTEEIVLANVCIAFLKRNKVFMHQMVQKNQTTALKWNKTMAVT